MFGRWICALASALVLLLTLPAQAQNAAASGGAQNQPAPAGAAEAPEAQPQAAAPDPTIDCEKNGGTLIRMPRAKIGDRFCLGRDFVSDVLKFTLLHEFGHAVIAAYEVSTFGQDEDDADRFATFALGNAHEFNVLTSAAAFWLKDSQIQTENGNGLGRTMYLNEHSWDEKRGYDLECHILGRMLFALKNENQDVRLNPEEVKKYLRNFGFYTDDDLGSLLSCYVRATKNVNDWVRILNGALVDTTKNDWRLSPPLVVQNPQYDPPIAADADAAAKLQASGVLEFLKDKVIGNNLLASKHLDSLGLHAINCATPEAIQQYALATHRAVESIEPWELANAAFVPKQKQIIVCYEIVDWINKVLDEIKFPQLVASLYGNTLYGLADLSGMKTWLQINPDGSYTQTQTRDGIASRDAGSWVLKSDNKTICLSPQPPPGEIIGAPPVCTPLAGHKIGDQWTATDDRGQSMQVTLLPGRN